VRVRVLFFGILKEVAGKAEDVLDLPAGAPACTVFDHYAATHPRLREMGRSILLARNQHFVRRSDALAEGDEVALLPPVSGGAPEYIVSVEINPAGHFFALTRSPIDVRALASRVLRGEDGAIVTFEGAVRNNTNGRRTSHLDYEAYEGMAVKVMSEIGGALAREFEITRVAMVHRLGRMLIGETSVAVVVSAPHRKAAFEAAIEGIDRLKRSVPIWKKEHFADGEVWVEGEWDKRLSES